MKEKWQPIETAPKDGTPILAWPCWVGPWSIGCVQWYEYKKGGRYFRRGWAYYGHHMVALTPTHWMPLPEIPSVR